MAKEFKTIKEQILLLNSRGIKTNQETEAQLMRESYYAIINGYKTPFLDKQAMKTHSNDRFLAGTEFEWIFALYSFDRDLRSLVFQFLDKAEATMQNAVTYAFCKKNPKPEAYLDKTCYVDASNMLVPKGFKGNREKLHRKNLDKLLKTLEEKKRDQNKSFVSHYSKEYGFVPLWVLQRNLTFGNIHHFYQLQNRSIQNDACKYIVKATGRKIGETRLAPLELLRAFSVLVDFRNLCAHGERLYCAKVGRSHDIPFRSLIDNMALVLSDKEIDALRSGIDELFEEYKPRFHIISRQSLLTDMGLKKK